MLARTLRGVLAATALVAAVSTTAEAQEASKGLGVYGGIALPMGDFGDAAELGFLVGGQYSIPLQNALGVRINADWNRFGLPDDVDGNWSLLGAMVNLTYNIETSTALKPYLLGGLGFYQYTLDIDGLGSSDDSGLGFNIGAGYNFMAGGRNLFAEIRYVSISTDGDALTMLPVTIGIRF